MGAQENRPRSCRQSGGEMNRRDRLLLLILVAGLLGGVVWLVLRPSEPVYQGKPLSYWLLVYDPSTGIGVESNTADQLLRQLGTNIIPTLCRMLRARDSELKLKLIALVQKQRFITVRYVPASDRHKAAVHGFENLGEV